jgi:hypothetical protein
MSLPWSETRALIIEMMEQRMTHPSMLIVLQQMEALTSSGRRWTLTNLHVWTDNYRKRQAQADPRCSAEGCNRPRAKGLSFLCLECYRRERG